MRKASLLALLICSFVISGCGNKQQDGELTARNKPLVLDDGRTVLRRGNGAEPETLDPHRAQSVTSSNILRDLYEGLVGEAPDGRLIPGAAERWEVSGDGKTYVFHLRKNAQWSNGDPVTAEDFAYGLRRCVDPATGSPYAEILAPIVNAKAVINGEKPPESLGVTALDAHTLQINLKAPTPYFLGLLTHSSSYPAHQGSIKTHGDAFTQPGKHVTNGPYVITEWVVASHITL
ncbi:MAG: peptide ABC transporter substrate-binding protein, partial [Salinisphaeraceae bacterium]|nr:peptide ABC transporter substrate-binding protein [Salinisphaeraceae bacterium]